MAADGSLIFNTKIDQSGFDKGTRTISSGVNKLKGSLKSLAKTAAASMPFSKVGGVQKNINGLTGSLKSLAGVAAAAFSAKQIIDFAKASKEAYNTQIEQETKLTTIMKQRMNATDDQISSVKALAAEQQKLGVIGDEVQLAGAQQVATFLTETDSIKTLLPAMNDLLAQQNGLNASTGDAVNIGNLMGKVLQGQTSALKRVGISFSEAEEQVLKYGSESERAAMLAQVITNNVGHMNQALAQTDAGKQKNLANTMSDIKEQFGQAVITIESAFLPLLARVVDGFSRVASVAQSAAAAIKSAFGVESDTNSASVAAATATSTAAAADSYEDIAESAEETKKAQENSLASFDKVIKIGKQENKSSSAAKGGTAGGQTGAVTLSPKTTAKASTWADKLKESLKKGDWGGLGKMLADKINGIVSKIKWKEVGKKLGQGITNAFTFAYNFLKNTKWKDIGTGLATFLNGIMQKTDFSLIGRTLGAKLNAMIGLAFGFVTTFNWAAAGLGLADIINGWFDEVDWEQLGDTLGGLVQGVISLAFNFVNSLDFAKMAKSFATAFNRFIKKINFRQLGQTVSKAFIGVWTFIGTALKEINWQQIGKSISEFINGIDWWGILKSLFGVIGGILKAAPELLLGVIKNLDFGNAAALFGTLFAPKIAKILYNKFIGDEGVIGTLKKAGNAIGNKINTGLDGESIGSGVGTKIASGLKTAGAVIGAAVIGWQIGTKLYECMKPGIDKITDALTDAMNADKYVKSNDNKIDTSNKLTVANLKKEGAWWLSKNDSGATLQRAANIINEAKKLGIAINDVYYQNGNYQKALKKLEESKRITEANKKLPSASSGNVKDTAKNKAQEELRTTYKNLAKQEAEKQVAANASNRSTIVNNLAKSIYNEKYKKKFNLPAYATGTVVPANFGRFLAVLGDNKKEPEVVSPVSAIKQAVLEAMAMKQQGKQPVTINISLDTRNGRRLLTKEVIDDINDIIDSTGKVPINI
jgi:hypothetical protein